MSHLDVTKPFSFVMPVEVLQQLAKGEPVFMTMVDNQGGEMVVKMEKQKSMPLETDEDPST